MIEYQGLARLSADVYRLNEEVRKLQEEVRELREEVTKLRGVRSWGDYTGAAP